MHGYRFIILTPQAAVPSLNYRCALQRLKRDLFIAQQQAGPMSSSRRIPRPLECCAEPELTVAMRKDSLCQSMSLMHQVVHSKFLTAGCSGLKDSCGCKVPIALANCGLRSAQLPSDGVLQYTRIGYQPEQRKRGRHFAVPGDARRSTDSAACYRALFSHQSRPFHQTLTAQDPRQAPKPRTLNLTRTKHSTKLAAPTLKRAPESSTLSPARNLTLNPEPDADARARALKS